jgi:hypothetical protein
MWDLTLKQIAAEAMAKEADALVRRAARRATASWTRLCEFAERDPDLLGSDSPSVGHA